MDQSELLQHVIKVLERLRIDYMVVGSLSSTFYGEPRMTQDIDIVISLSPEQVDALCSAFPPDEFYVSAEAVVEALERSTQFNLIHPASGGKVDFLLARSDAWGRAQMSRRRLVRIAPDLDAVVASPEDAIIGKMIYYREGGSEKHLRDITGIMSVSGEQVDVEYVREWAARLGLSEVWEAVLERAAQ